ncbi:hypothetical protein DOK67_0001429 [Enterococcus sp. DIV0212c]|uniref:LPXTG cell wall anchor domain-containing protein n=1 Tax=Enterococcus sp. DIV0212c TaxID=2230867 RepID=UPI001A9C1B1A|nr:LPXTG cell wall anchor domain-containing protein [Enterococcus sp. DIV0212c]MBO1354363.1 LPXTG cell wall anchor domain-containing protein [Enterococcus sp. DIV0212c]
MKKIKYLVLSSIVCISLFILLPTSVNAEGENNGGGIQTSGDVGFYEETKSTAEPTTTSTTSSSKKPIGRYPSTGELIKVSLSISGAMIIFIASIAFFWKRKKASDKRKGGVKE